MTNPQIEALPPMTFTELLRRHLTSQITQKSIAMDWMDRRDRTKTRTAKPPKPSYVESTFSRCLKGEASAVRFFFADRADAVALLDAMQVPDKDRDAILSAADVLVETKGEPPARLVIDLTPWGSLSTAQQKEQLFAALRAKVIEPALVQPAVLLLSNALYDALPRSFDAVAWLRAERIEPEDAEDRIADLTEAGALLLSSAPKATPERWLAAEYDHAKGLLALEPPDGLARFARDGAIPLPSVAHDLAGAVRAEDGIPVFDASRLSPVDRRRLMAQLRDEATADAIDTDPRQRLAMARALGITATSTARDRREVELNEAFLALGIAEPAAMSRDAFAKLLDRARRRSVPPTIVRVEDEIRALNPAADQPGLDHPLVRTDRIEADEPWISRLRAAVADWTLGDYEADPFLVAVMERLDPEGRDVLPLLHARAWLLAAKTLEPRPAEVVDDWRPVLRDLLAQRVPAAALRLIPDAHDRYYSRDKDSFFTLPPSGRLATVLPDLGDATANRLRHVVSPISYVPFGREAPIRVANEKANNGGWPYQRDAVKLVLPDEEILASPATFDDTWLEAYEAFSTGKHSSGLVVQPLEITTPTDRWGWPEYDRQLGRAWLALSAAVDSAPATQLASGEALLTLGGGVAAEIRVTKTASNVGALRAMLDCVVSRQSSFTASTEASIASGIHYVHLTVPHGIVLLCGQTRVEIDFSASPLLLGLGASSTERTFAAIAVGEHRRHSESDSSDDDD